MPDVDKLIDLLARVVGVIREEDLLDPEMASLLSQVCAVLDPNPEPLPKALVEHLQGIEDHIERFKQAALKLGSSEPAQLKSVLESMKAAGLLKHQGG